MAVEATVPRCPSHPDAFMAYFPWEGYHRCTECEWNTAPGQKWPNVFTFGEKEEMGGYV